MTKVDSNLPRYASDTTSTSRAAENTSLLTSTQTPVSTQTPEDLMSLSEVKNMRGEPAPGATGFPPSFDADGNVQVRSPWNTYLTAESAMSGQLQLMNQAYAAWDGAVFAGKASFAAFDEFAKNAKSAQTTLDNDLHQWSSALKSGDQAAINAAHESFVTDLHKFHSLITTKPHF